MTDIHADIVEEGQRVLDAAQAKGVPLRLLGGVAVRLRSAGLPVALLLEHDVTDDDSGVNAARVAGLCADDWGLWRTITHNLGGVASHLDAYDVDRERVAGRLQRLQERIEAEPKSRGWRLRAKVG